MHYDLDNAPDTYIDRSSMHGFGLFAQKNFLKGDIIVNYGLFPDVWYTTLYSKLSQEKIANSAYIMLDNIRCITTDKKTKFKYVNHSRFANCTNSFKDKLIIAIRDINIHEEILIDYRQEPLAKGATYPFWI